MLILANIIGFVTLYWKQCAVIAAILLLLVSVALWYSCSDSRTGKRIEDRSPVIQETQSGANVAQAIAVNANVEAVEAVKAANAIRANKKANVSVDEVKRSMCAAYPEIEACKK